MIYCEGGDTIIATKGRIDRLKGFANNDQSTVVFDDENIIFKSRKRGTLATGGGARVLIDAHADELMIVDNTVVLV